LPQGWLRRLRATVKPKRIRKISVIIPTRNRLDVLKSYALKSLGDIEFTEADWEIIVVDNDSDDGTFDYLCRERIPHLKVVWEKTRGASAARNAGIRAADGDVLAFIDDDCSVDRDWLKRVYDGHNEHAFVAGQGYILNVPEDKILNLVPRDEYENNFREGNISFRREVFDNVSFNESMPYAQEGWDLIGQIKVLWGDFPHFTDTMPIRHYCTDSEYRHTGDYTPTPRGSSVEAKMGELRSINKHILRRNLGIDSIFFTLTYVLREVMFFPLELSFLGFDSITLIKTKIRAYKQLLKIRQECKP